MTPPYTPAHFIARAEACEYDAEYSKQMRLAGRPGYLESDEIELSANAALLRHGAACAERWETLKAKSELPGFIRDVMYRLEREK